MDECKERIDGLRTRIYKLNLEIKTLNKTIDDLKKRCIRQSDEIVRLKAFLSEEGYIEDKHRITKK